MTPHPGVPDDGVPADALFERLRERIAVQRRIAPRAGCETAQLDARSFGHIAATIEQAAHFGRVGETLPPLGHLGTLRRWLASALGRVLLYFFRLITVDQQRFNGLVLRALRIANANAQGLHAEIHAIPGNVLGALRERDARLATLEDELAARDRRLHVLELASGERDQGIARLAADVAECAQRVRGAQSDLAERMEHDDRVGAAQQMALADLRSSLTILRAQLDALQRQQVRGVTAAMTSTMPPSPRQPPSAPPLLSALVASDVLRGNEAGVSERQARYVPYFAGATDVLDVGCGRGEFLGLLRAAGVSARGVDSDLDMVLRCREQGLEAAHDDALHYLAELPDAALGGLVCIQVIEHWPAAVQVEFVQHAARTLRPGARLLIETLNPESLLVLYRWYWLDVTHERLVHPEALQYLLRAAGFLGVECVFAPPPVGPVRIPPLTIAGTDEAALRPFNAATQYLNDLLYASFDYTVVAER